MRDLLSQFKALPSGLRHNASLEDFLTSKANMSFLKQLLLQAQRVLNTTMVRNSEEHVVAGEKLIMEQLGGEYGFFVEWTVQKHRVHFRAYQVLARDKQGSPLFESPKGLVHNYSLADPEVTGYFGRCGTGRIRVSDIDVAQEARSRDSLYGLLPYLCARGDELTDTLLEGKNKHGNSKPGAGCHQSAGQESAAARGE